MDPIKESVGLLIDTWALFVRRLPTGNVSHSDGVAAALGNVPLPCLNMCMSDSPIESDEELQRRLGGPPRADDPGCRLARSGEWQDYRFVDR